VEEGKRASTCSSSPTEGEKAEMGSANLEVNSGNLRVTRFMVPESVNSPLSRPLCPRSNAKLFEDCHREVQKQQEGVEDTVGKLHELSLKYQTLISMCGCFHNQKARFLKSLLTYLSKLRSLYILVEKNPGHRNGLGHYPGR
jgi:hypothetical protein